jgi:hypothetical protein
MELGGHLCDPLIHPEEGYVAKEAQPDKLDQPAGPHRRPVRLGFRDESACMPA